MNITSLSQNSSLEFIEELNTLAEAIDQGKMKYPEGRLDLLQDLVMVRVKIQQLELTKSHEKQLHSIQNLCNLIILGQPRQQAFIRAFEFADRGHIGLWNVVKRDLGDEGEKFTAVRELFTAMRTDPDLLDKQLFDAARKGHFEVVKLLIEDERVDKGSITYAMGIAAENGHSEIVLLFVSKNLGDYATYNAICSAVNGNHIDIFRMLLPTMSCTYNKQNINDLLSILFYRTKDVELFKELIQDPRFVFSNSIALEKSIQYGLAEVVSLLLQRDVYSVDGLLHLATMKGHKDLVKVFLHDRRFDQESQHKASIACAAANGNVELVALFCEDSQVLSDLSFVVIPAAENGHTAVISYLLTNVAVKAAHCKAALEIAVRENRGEVVKELLKNPNLSGSDLQGILSLAVENDSAEAVSCLLLDNRVNPREVLNNNCFVYVSALEKNFVSVIKVLVNDKRIPHNMVMQQALIKGIKPPRHEALSIILSHMRPDSALDMLRYLMANSQHPLIKQFIEHVCRSDMKVYGLPLNKVIRGRFTEDFLKSYIENPIIYLEALQKEKDDYPMNTIKSPTTIAAVRILFTAEQVRVHKRKIAKQERDRNRFNNVDDEARISAVRAHFSKVIQPHFSLEFTGLGVVGIEYQIRKMLLETIQQEAQEDIVAFISSLSDEDKNLLLQGDNPELMQKARTYFSDTKSAAQTAWRAYDKWANVGGVWPNLLTAPLGDADSAVYTVAAVGLKEPSTKMASDLTREMIAYSFLLAIDKNDGDEDARATRKTAFIAKIAEIRRAHNAQDEEQDDPSCLPGTISRVGDMWIAHSKNMTPDTLKLLEEELRSIVIEQFQKFSKAEQSDIHQALLLKSGYNKDLSNFLSAVIQETPSEQASVYNALVLLSSCNADDVINRKSTFTADQLTLRQAFIDSLGTYQQLQAVLNARFEARGSRALSNEEFSIYVPALLADIGGSWIVTQLTSILRQFASFENPFSYISPQKGISQQAATALLMKLLAAVEVENKMNFIVKVARHLTLGNIEGATQELQKVGIASDALSQALVEHEQLALRLAEKRKQKSALWDALYKKQIINNADLLKEIVDSVIDNDLDLQTVLSQHGLLVE